jgi:hypothetical protein
VLRKQQGAPLTEDTTIPACPVRQRLLLLRLAAPHCQSSVACMQQLQHFAALRWVQPTRKDKSHREKKATVTFRSISLKESNSLCTPYVVQREETSKISDKCIEY